MTPPVRPAAAHRPPLAEVPDRRLAGVAGLRVPLPVARWAGRPAGEWPLHSFLELGAMDGAVPSARLHARHVLREWGLAALGDDAELVVSELVTNGVQASRAMTHAAIRLWLASDRAQAVICVWDASLQPPVRMDPAQDAEHGHLAAATSGADHRCPGIARGGATCSRAVTPAREAAKPRG